MNQTDRSKHAIVIGASMSGLLAARVLSDHFERVTILERDVFPTETLARKGVPQGQHAHLLLGGGYRALLDLFPDLESELREAGGILIDLLDKGYLFLNGAFLAPAASNVTSALISRPNLEAIIRNRVLGLDNVVVQTKVAVTGLLTQGNNQVIGVQYDSAQNQQQLAADLVVDASGRGSRSPTWLETMGFAAPELNEVKVNVGYSTCIFERSDSELNGKLFMVIAPKAPDQKRGAVIIAQEGNRWVVGLIGMFGDHPPTDQAGFLEFARSLPTPEIYDIIKHATPLSEIVPYKYPSSLRRHYEKLKSFPQGFLVLGDAMCSFNPIFGQGMTVASLEAKALEASLCNGLDGLRQRFFKRAAAVIDTAWKLAAGPDFAFAETIGKRGPEVKLINAYVAKFLTAASHDSKLTKKFFNVNNLLESPSSLFAPSIVWRVWRGSRRRKNLQPSYTTG